MLIALMVATTQAGFIDDLTTYYWRWFVYFNSMGGVMGCWAIGLWGLLFDDDDGLLMNTCFKMWGGSAVMFEDVEYSMN